MIVLIVSCKYPLFLQIGAYFLKRIRMNWINAFEILCYIIVGILIVDIVKEKNYRELELLISGAIAGFSLELLAVRFTDIYHYSQDFNISIGFKPYQFPFFGGLMWGGISVCALRIARKFNFDNFTTALVGGFIVVTMDLILDVVTIRLDGGFWVWDGRPITLDINHHMFMSVIWVNFLGYMFEVPAILYMTLKNWEKEQNKFNLLKSILIGFAGVLFVSICSGISLFLNSITDEWFAFVAFTVLWIYILIVMLKSLVIKRNYLTFSCKNNWIILVFFGSLYTYCLLALVSLDIVRLKPIYGLFAVLISLFSLFLSIVEMENNRGNICK